MPKVLNIYSGNLYGGVETMLLAMAKQAGWMSFALCFDGKLSRALRNTVSGFDNRLHQLGEVRLRAPWSVFRARNRLRRLLAQGKFDAVICHSAWSYSLFAGVARAAIVG